MKGGGNIKARREGALERVIGYFTLAVNKGDLDKAKKHFLVVERTAANLEKDDQVKKDIAETVIKFQKLQRDKAKKEPEPAAEVPKDK